MIDKHEWHAVATDYGAAVISGFRTICRINWRDMFPVATAIEQAQEIADLHNHATIEITAGALALAQTQEAAQRGHEGQEERARNTHGRLGTGSRKGRCSRKQRNA